MQHGLCLSYYWKKPGILQPGKAPVSFLQLKTRKAQARVQPLVWWLRAEHDLSASIPG